MNEHTRANRLAQSKPSADAFALQEETPVRFDPPSTNANDGWASRVGADYAIAASGSETRESWAGF